MTLYADIAEVTSVASSATVVDLLAPHNGRKGFVIANSSTAATLYVKLGEGAGLTDWSYELLPGGVIQSEMVVFRGLVTGIWTAVDGSAKVTELL